MRLEQVRTHDYLPSLMGQAEFRVGIYVEFCVRHNGTLASACLTPLLRLSQNAGVYKGPPSCIPPSNKASPPQARCGTAKRYINAPAGAFPYRRPQTAHTPCGGVCKNSIVRRAAAAYGSACLCLEGARTHGCLLSKVGAERFEGRIYIEFRDKHNGTLSPAVPTHSLRVSQN